MPVQELVSFAPWTFIFQICNLLIQMYLIKRFLFKPVNAMLEKRQAMADAEIQDAIKAKDEAQAMKTEYEQNMKEARDKANDIKAKAESDIVQERRKAVNEIKDEIGSMAMEIAGKVIEREINEADHTKLIDDFIANVGEVS